MSFVARFILQLVIVFGPLGIASQGLAETPTQQREAAVLKARAGHMPEAQAELRRMLERGIDDGLVAMDLVTLLQQDGKSAEAVAVFEKAAAHMPPDYALLAAARAYRNVGRYDSAVQLARQGLARFAGQPVWALLLSLALSDLGRTNEALDVLRRPPASAAAPVERLMAEAYAWRRAGNPVKALQLYAEAAQQAPQNRDIAVERAGVLQGMGAPYGAGMVAPPSPAIEADQAAAMVRWGADIRPSDPARRFAGTDAALARLDSLLAALPPPPEQAELRRQLRLDRLLALHDRVRMAEAIAEAESLKADSPLPQYAEGAYADALLYMRRPEEARAAYQRVLAASPKDVVARYGLFYAAIELEDFATAYATVDLLVADEPLWRTYKSDPSLYPNLDRQYAEVTAAQARFYGNQLGEAWARITRISDAAPADGHARLALYQVANARGWPQRAREEAGIAATLAPLDLGSRMALIETAMADHRYREAQKMLDELLAVYPEDRAVQRLARELKAKRSWLLEAEARPGNSDGGGPNASGKTVTLEGRLTSPPIADNWRVFALGNYANANPPEGFVERMRAGGGIDWRIPDLTTSVHFAPSWGTLSRAGGGGSLDWVATDQLRVALAAELFSWETPLRALLKGTTADEVAVKATWRWHESRSLAVSGAYMPFTDGNRRFAGGLVYHEKVVNLPGFDVTALAEGYTSANSLTNASYYNPQRDLSLSGGLLAEHTLWRRYDHSLVQALTLDAGLYSEYGYNDNWIGTINYEHRWRFDPLTELHYGVVLTRRVYDGSVENGIALMIGLSQRI
jgi:biofilm PGA synthesis protein PgaA